MQQAVVQALTQSGSLVSDIAGGSISADLLDYLRRDTYFRGLSQYYDSRIFESFVAENGRLVITLSERGYFHHTKMASGAMLCKAV